MTYKVNGRTVTKASTPAEQRKAEREIETFRRYRQLERSFVEINEKICHARPRGGCAGPGGKKTAEAIHTEIAREVAELIFAERKQAGGMDLTAVEMAPRVAMHQVGAAALTRLLQFPEPTTDQRAIPCPCGQRARYRERRARHILTALVEVELSRPWYLCPHCHNASFLSIATRCRRPRLLSRSGRMQALVGQDSPFDHGREQMKILAGLKWK